MRLKVYLKDILANFKKIIMLLVILVLFDCSSTNTFIKDGVIWQSQGKVFENNYKTGSNKLLRNERFNPSIIKDS